jgi:hypothetical protein
LDYLDFWMRSIHSHAAQVPCEIGSSELSITSSQSQMHSDNAVPLVTIQLDDGNSITFKKAALSPPIIIVGTHKNSLNGQRDKDETIKRAFEKIKEFVSDKPYAKHIVDICFAIDTSLTLTGASRVTERSENESEKEKEHANNSSTNSTNNNNCSRKCYWDDMNTLRRVIEQVALNEPYMGEQLPVKWMNFEKSLEKLKSKDFFYASLSQV